LAFEECLMITLGALGGTFSGVLLGLEGAVVGAILGAVFFGVLTWIAEKRLEREKHGRAPVVD
jgi:prepilin signal peptidase PulO-like enzyme (type II secretory pathway)